MKDLFYLLFYLSSTVLSGQDQDWLSGRDSLFQNTNSKHFNIFYLEDVLSKSQLQDLVTSREIAYDSIANFFQLTIDISTNIFLFPDEQIKQRITGHRGHGWAFENNIVEVFNDSIRVDPYHELVHRLGYSISTPPALIDEGLAVYLSHKFAHKPFSKTLGFPENSINEILHFLTKDKDLIEISTLYSIDEISQANNAPLAYCQSASFVEYLITTYGKETFLELFTSFAKTSRGEYEQVFFQLYGKKIDQVENQWIKYVGLN
ncbi:MAG: hypothetical protein ABJG78_13155 [Cyclobacteriaceae bacterium]